ncbi:MAG TPA: hypothetical protein VEL03_19010 [Streptosporangiaceae bacterium]|nr:hypothetical protein [Streptosporangiaceae bacterium]
MNADQVAALRALLAPTGWLDRTGTFARALRHRARTPGGLLIVGTPGYEPWHMTAHLADESRLTGIPELEPTLVRWAPAAGAPPHLSTGLGRLAEASRRETLLVVSPQVAPPELLERVDDVRRLGATVFALDRGDPELDGIAHESLAVPLAGAPVTFDAAQHLVSTAAAETPEPDDGPRHRRASAIGWAQPGEDPAQPASLRTRLARLLDAVTGTVPD